MLNCEEFWVAADGRFNPCCAPNEQRLSLGYFGNLNEDCSVTDCRVVADRKTWIDDLCSKQNHPLTQALTMDAPWLAQASGVSSIRFPNPLVGSVDQLRGQARRHPQRGAI